MSDARKPTSWKDVKQDCFYFKGNIPCKPNKESGHTCPDCPAYRAVSHRILIIKLGAIGDVVRTTPLLTRYRSLYPDCHITWVTDFPAVLPKGEIQEVLSMHNRDTIRLKHTEFDIALNLDKEAEACTLLKEVRAREKYGFTWENGAIAPATPAAEAKLLTGLFDKVSKENKQSYLQEIFPICHQAYRGEPYLVDTDPQLQEKWQHLITEKADGKTVIGLNTGYGRRWPTRKWPDAMWRKLIAGLRAQGYFCILLGGEDEDLTNVRLSGETGAWYPGHFSIAEFTAILSCCELLVSQVTMAMHMHLCLGLGRKLVLMNNIFNRHEFDLFGLGEIIEPDQKCVCYFGASCHKGESCMKDLDPEKVLAAVNRQVRIGKSASVNV